MFTNVQATDSAGASSQTQLDVAVRPGPNIRPPFFTKLVYTAQVGAGTHSLYSWSHCHCAAQVSEAAPRHTSVATVSARDPEDSPVSFFITYMLKPVLYLVLTKANYLC